MSPESAPAGESSAGAARAVAVFDLDGTLTHRDTLLPYLVNALAARPVRAWRLSLLPFALVGFLADRDRGRLKSRLIRAVLGGVPRPGVEAATRRFCERRGNRLYRAEALAALERHRAAGDYLVLLSASADCYVRELGRRLRFDEVICTELEWRGEQLDGRLATPNRRGEEKTRCVQRLKAAHPGARISAYGNARSDLDHLMRVDHGVLVNGSAAARRAARAHGLPVADWR